MNCLIIRIYRDLPKKRLSKADIDWAQSVVRKYEESEIDAKAQEQETVTNGENPKVD